MAERPTILTRTLSCLLAAVVLLANPLLHRVFSDLCDELARRFGFERYDRVALVGLSVISVLGLAAVLHVRRRWPRQPRIVAGLVLLALLSLGAHRYLTFTSVELIHYLQYALPAALLLLGGLPRQAAWGVSTAAGVADEVYQYLVVFRDRPSRYLDFNDMLLNGIGATWAALLGGGASSTACSWWVAASWAGALAIALWRDTPRAGPLLRRSPSGRLYRRLSASEAIAATAVLWSMVALLPARERPATSEKGQSREGEQG